MSRSWAQASARRRARKAFSAQEWDRAYALLSIADAELALPAVDLERISEARLLHLDEGDLAGALAAINRRMADRDAFTQESRAWLLPALSGVLLLVTGYLFEQHQLTAGTLTLCWSVVFFFASAGVSAAYLTVSEIFPMETRALCIALFYAVGIGIGGIIGPQLFGPMVATGKTSELLKALAIGAILMIIGGVVEIAFGIKAERKGLEGIAKPLTAVESAIRGTAARAGRAAAGPQPQRASTSAARLLLGRDEDRVVGEAAVRRAVGDGHGWAVVPAVETAQGLGR
jgi:hypothetical protein